MSAKRTVATWSEWSPWQMTGPPNGCLPPSPCRDITEYQLYAADYYGTGEKLYLRGRRRVQNEYGVGPVCGVFEDGHPDRIATYLRRAGVEVE